VWSARRKGKGIRKLNRRRSLGQRTEQEVNFKFNYKIAVTPCYICGFKTWIFRSIDYGRLEAAGMSFLCCIASYIAWSKGTRRERVTVKKKEVGQTCRKWRKAWLEHLQMIPSWISTKKKMGRGLQVSSAKLSKLSIVTGFLELIRRPVF
jgi:hypothetical protein